MDQTSPVPDYAFRLVVTKKELSGTDSCVITAIAPGTDPNTLNAQFAGCIPRALTRGVELEDQIEIYIVLRPKTESQASADELAQRRVQSRVTEELAA